MKEDINNMGYYSRVDSMMLEIVDNGEKEVQMVIEAIKCPYNRTLERKIYHEALERIKKNIKGKKHG